VCKKVRAGPDLAGVATWFRPRPALPAPSDGGVDEGVANYFDSQPRDLAGVPAAMLVFLTKKILGVHGTTIKNRCRKIVGFCRNGSTRAALNTWQRMWLSPPATCWIQKGLAPPEAFLLVNQIPFAKTEIVRK
jgi:hypothetical protein